MGTWNDPTAAVLEALWQVILVPLDAGPEHVFEEDDRLAWQCRRRR